MTFDWLIVDLLYQHLCSLLFDDNTDCVTNLKRSVCYVLRTLGFSLGRSSPGITLGTE